MPWIALISVIIFWASSFIGIKIGLDSFTPSELALFRYIIASIFILLIYLRAPNKKLPNRKDLLLLLICGMTGVGIYNLALNHAEIYVSPAISSFIIAMMPLCSLIIGMIIFNDKIKKRAFLCIGISIIGLIIIFLTDIYYSINLQASLGGFAALIVAVIGMAIYTNTQRILLKRGFKPLEMTAWSIWLGTICMLFFLPNMISELGHASFRDIVAVIYLGIFPAAIAYACWGFALSKLPFTKVVTALYFSPVFVIAMQWLVLGQLPYLFTFIGGAISVSGAIYLTRQKM